MPLTPLDIEKKEFRRVFRGYSEEEVDDFLDLVNKDYETLYRENMDLKERLQYLQEQTEQYQRLEETLKNTLIMAQQTAEEAKDNARREGELLLEEARKRAQELEADTQKQIEEVQRRYQQVRQEFKAFYSSIKTQLETQLKLLADLEEELKV